MHLGLVGYGNIGKALLGLMGAGEPARLTVLARPGKTVDLPGAEVVETVQELIAAAPDLLVECAGHAAVRGTAVPALRAGIDVVLVSIGALSDVALERALHAAAEEGGARLILPAGAVGLSVWAVITRMTRASVLEVLQRDYVRPRSFGLC